MRLTKKDIDRANKRRKYSDGRGLFLSVSKRGSKTWSFCYRFPEPSKDTTGPDGTVKRGYREREMGLGSQLSTMGGKRTLCGEETPR